MYSLAFLDPGPAGQPRTVHLPRPALDRVLPGLGRHRPCYRRQFLQAESGHDPYDRALSDLVGELSTRSHEFRVRWAAHDVKYYRSGVQPFHHPLVGDLTLNYDALEIPADPGQTIIAYTTEPDSPSQRTSAPVTSSTHPPTSGTGTAPHPTTS
ncbi:MAG: hypothetical protein ACRDRO_08450 [Pseudonocardiaceae bacterium]